MAPKAKKEGARFLINYSLKTSIIPQTLISIFVVMVMEAVMFVHMAVWGHLHSRNAVYNLMKCRTGKTSTVQRHTLA